MRSITKKEIDAARENSDWDLANGLLYDLCRSHPCHKKNDEIIAKAWLIGRAYSAAIERRQKADKRKDFYGEKVVPEVKQSAIDKWLSSVSKDPSLGNAILVHKQVMDLFASISGDNKRVLASKYLHFHFPEVFFLYDSRANKGINKIVPRLSRLHKIPVGTYDKAYKSFVEKCAWLRNEIISKHNVTMMPREIDRLLLAICP
jgi:hypothetical protein